LAGRRPPTIGTTRFAASITATAPFDAVRGPKAFRNEGAFDVCLVPQTIEHVVEHVRRLRVTGTIYEQACWSISPRHSQQPDGIHIPREQLRGFD
jgi:hypothetical protein